MINGSEKYIEAIKYCGQIYDFLNAKFFQNELKKPVITLAPCERNKFTGWFVLKEVWKESAEDKGETEINISTNFLNRPVINIFETMLHEMCHQYAYDNKIKDCSRGGAYHNKIFKRIAETHGLIVDKLPTIGYARTDLTNDSKKIIEAFLKDNNFSFIYRDLVFKGQKIKSSSTRKYICPCCNQSVRATKQVNIICADCNEPMCEDE